jgi:hypothetical protein
MGQLDLRPGCIVLIEGFDDIPEHEFRIEEIYEEFVTGMALSGPFAGGIRRTRQRDDHSCDYSGNNQGQLSVAVREGLKPSPSLFLLTKSQLNIKTGAIAPVRRQYVCRHKIRLQAA